MPGNQAAEAEPTARPVHTPGRSQADESPKERVDRELRELLDEVRVILPGVEILFGFLIILPFEFSEELTGFERLLYLGAFLSVSAGLALLVAPTTYHRLRFREADKERMVFLANRLVAVATIFVALGIGLAVYLVVETILGGPLAAGIAAVNAAWFAWFWFGLPLWRRQTGQR
jgi:multisubunit Na+/H+ antiporter MnhG subunit